MDFRKIYLHAVHTAERNGSYELHGYRITSFSAPLGWPTVCISLCPATALAAVRVASKNGVRVRIHEGVIKLEVDKKSKLITETLIEDSAIEISEEELVCIFPYTPVTTRLPTIAIMQCLCCGEKENLKNGTLLNLIEDAHDINHSAESGYRVIHCQADGCGDRFRIPHMPMVKALHRCHRCLSINLLDRTPGNTKFKSTVYKTLTCCVCGENMNIDECGIRKRNASGVTASYVKSNVVRDKIIYPLVNEEVYEQRKAQFLEGGIKKIVPPVKKPKVIKPVQPKPEDLWAKMKPQFD